MITPKHQRPNRWLVTTTRYACFDAWLHHVLMETRKKPAASGEATGLCCLTNLRLGNQYKSEDPYDGRAWSTMS
jgi:hypothetical protein